MNFKLADKIPVIFHHLRGYYSHFIMQEIGQIAKKHTYKNKKGEEQQMNINDYMSSFDKSNEKQLPKKDFYSILNNEHISDKDYTYAKNVWKTFNLKSIGEYHDLFLISDILLLSDVFENFR